LYAETGHLWLPIHNHETVKSFAEDLKDHHGEPENTTDAYIDMSKAFIKGVNLEFKS